MKITTELTKIGIGLYLGGVPTLKSEDSFSNYMFAYDFSVFGVSLSCFEGTNICHVIGITFDIDDIVLYNEKKLISFIHKEASKRLKCSK